jgi:dTMP kinase
MGIFVTIEGPNGAGKSTLIDNLSSLITSNSLGSVYYTKEPTRSDFGEYVKKNESKLEGKTYAHLIAADRCYHVEQEILPNLNKYNIIISDRYIESSLVLQRFDGVDIEYIWKLNSEFPRPNLSVILLATEDQLAQRLSMRSSLSRYEISMKRIQEIEYYRDAASYLNNKGFNTIILDNSEIHFEKNVQAIYDIIKKLLGGSTYGK